MPLKLLKRSSKQYNVVSKSSFVISVELLDNGIMECTLDADSTGTDCLQNISQRLGLHQVSIVANNSTSWLVFLSILRGSSLL